jgi:Double-GTPase 2
MDGGLVSWSGNNLGMKNLHLVAARSSPILIGILGPHDSGKTTYLSLLYRRLRHGDRIGNFRFAGSYTLLAWEAISEGFKWPQKDGFQFPAHTSRNQGRIPGLLHLAVRDENGRLRDILFTDAPGEWFSDWADNATNDQSEGARWIHQNASAFLVFADGKRLAGSSRGSAKNQLQSILQRVGTGIGNRPLALAWSKADESIPEEIKKGIRRVLDKTGNQRNEFEISYHQEFVSNYVNCIGWLLSQSLKIDRTDAPLERSKDADFFFQIR